MDGQTQNTSFSSDQTYQTGPFAGIQIRHDVRKQRAEDCPEKRVRCTGKPVGYQRSSACTHHVRHMN